MTKSKGRCIIRIAKRILCSIRNTQSETPRAATLGVSFWDFVGLISVNPLADIVANYTSHNRDTKGYYVFQKKHLLPDGRSRQCTVYHISTKCSRGCITAPYFLFV